AAPAIELDAGESQRRRLDVCPVERFHTEEMGLVRIDLAVVIHQDRRGGDLQQRVGGGVESAGLDVHHHRQKAAEALCHGCLASAVGGGTIQCFVVVVK